MDHTALRMKPGETWTERKLEVGEMVELGDLIQFGERGEWIPIAEASIGKPYNLNGISYPAKRMTLLSKGTVK